MKRSILIGSVLMLAACGEGTAQHESSSSPAAPPATNAGATADQDLQGIVLRYAPGGTRPDRFCEPQWSIANQTDSDLPGLLIEIAWHGVDGAVLQAVGEFGSLFENLKAGQLRDRSLAGHPVACKDLNIVVGRYACRDENAVRMPCPGPLHVRTEGGIRADVSALQEGPMRGAITP